MAQLALQDLDGATTSVVRQALSGTIDEILAPVRLQADRLVLGLLILLSLISAVLAPIHDTWWAAGVTSATIATPVLKYLSIESSPVFPGEIVAQGHYRRHTGWNSGGSRCVY